MTVGDKITSWKESPEARSRFKGYLELPDPPDNSADMRTETEKVSSSFGVTHGC